MEPSGLITLLSLFATAPGAGIALTAIGVLVGVQVIAGLLIWLWLVANLGGSDDPGSAGDGPGGSRRPPKPPEPPSSWPDFERQFAEHVKALGDRDMVANR